MREGATYLRTHMIGPVEISVYEVENLADDDEKLKGEFDATNLCVYIDAAQSPREKLMTELHEIIHAVSWLYGLGINEQRTRCLEMGLFQAFESELGG